jgi:hypothetical protein
MSSRLPYLSDAAAPQPGANKRRFGRVVCQDIQCTLGEILDLSAGGARVKCRSKPPDVGKHFNMELRTLDGALLMDCVVRWVRKSGLFGHQVGVEFCDLTDEHRRALTALARASAHNEVLRDGR